ncbi:MAG: hypothetical protein K2R98_19115 [Gemmataceae bacterium]|nr:hypothetical protein [Gemmataceae bacterium]
MADASSQLILDALSRAAADPAGLPLYGTKTAPGLFPANATAKQAAQRCKDDQFLSVVRTETQGKKSHEICALTEKGLTYLMSEASPKQVLEQMVRALDGHKSHLADLAARTRQMQVGLDAFQATATKLMQSTGKSSAGDLYAAWANKAPAKNDSAAPEPTTAILTALTQWQAHDTTEDCPLPELFRRSQPAADMSIGQFHDALRKLYDQSRVYLHPWTGPLSELPEPPYALLVGHEIAYYGSIRK